MSKELYNDTDIKTMKATKESISKSRIEELVKFAKESEYKKIGIANCLSMQKYADKLKSILVGNNFEVYSVNCRKGDLSYADIFNDEIQGSCCDPAFQAKHLNDEKTELNINIGLCLGHGIIFNKYSKAPVTTLIVKDFSTKHKTINELED